MPPELKAKRNVIIFNADECISEDRRKIKEEIMTKNIWAEDVMENVCKFPKGNTFKVAYK